MKLLLVLIATFVALCYLVAWLLHIEHWAHGPTFLLAVINVGALPFAAVRAFTKGDGT